MKLLSTLYTKWKQLFVCQLAIDIVQNHKDAPNMWVINYNGRSFENKNQVINKLINLSFIVFVVQSLNLTFKSIGISEGFAVIEYNRHSVGVLVVVVVVELLELVVVVVNPLKGKSM